MTYTEPHQLDANTYLQGLGLIVVVMSAINSCPPNTVLPVPPLIETTHFEPLNIVGFSGHLPMLVFLTLAILQIAVIVSGNENQIMVGKTLKQYNVRNTTLFDSS